MQTNVISTGTAATKEPFRARTGATQRVLIVNGTGDVLDVLEPVLEAGNYDVVFVESSAHAYSQIKRVKPDLVILCLEMDDADALTVLSMMKLDEETRGSPVVTYTTAGDEDQEDDEQDDWEPPIFASRPALLMN